MKWEREFFSLASDVLNCKLVLIDPEPLPDGRLYSPAEVLIGELTYSCEMRLVLSEAGMLPAQRLGRLAAGLFLAQERRFSVVKNQSRGKVRSL